MSDIVTPGVKHATALNPTTLICSISATCTALELGKVIKRMIRSCPGLYGHADAYGTSHTVLYFQYSSTSSTSAGSQRQDGSRGVSEIKAANLEQLIADKASTVLVSLSIHV